LNRFGEWVARRSRVQRFFIWFFIDGVLFGVGMGVLMPTVGVKFGVAAAVVAGILFGAVMSAATLRGGRRSAGQAMTIQLNAAIRSGDLPDPIEPMTWLTDLDQRLAALRRSQVSLPVLFGLVFLSQVGLSLIGHSPNFVFLVLALLLAFAGTALTVSIRRAIPKIEALEQKIRAAYNLRDADATESAV
jgi:hypothetical protein